MDCRRRAGKPGADKGQKIDSRLFAPVLLLRLRRVAEADKAQRIDSRPFAPVLLLHKAAEVDRVQRIDSRLFAPVLLLRLHKAAGVDKGWVPFSHRLQTLGGGILVPSVGIGDDSGPNGLPEDAPRWYHPEQACESADWCPQIGHHSNFPAPLHPPFPSTLKALPMSHHR